MKIGVLALQGDFAEHIAMLKRLKVDTAEVRLPEHLKGLDGLIIPGGESTTWQARGCLQFDGAVEGFGQRMRSGNVCWSDLLSKDVAAPNQQDSWTSSWTQLWRRSFLQANGIASKQPQRKMIMRGIHPRADH
jgi:hypothetical protein